MPARKMRVELFDNEGNRYTIAFEGQVTRDKSGTAVRLNPNDAVGDLGSPNPKPLTPKMEVTK